MSYGITDQTTKHGCNPVCAVICFESERLLGRCVPPDMGCKQIGQATNSTPYMDMISTKPGLTVDSRRPSMNRFAAVPAKVLHAGVVMRMMPHPRADKLNQNRFAFAPAYPMYRTPKISPWEDAAEDNLQEFDQQDIQNRIYCLPTIRNNSATHE